MNYFWFDKFNELFPKLVDSSAGSCCVFSTFSFGTGDQQQVSIFNLNSCDISRSSILVSSCLCWPCSYVFPLISRFIPLYFQISFKELKMLPLSPASIMFSFYLLWQVKPSTYLNLSLPQGSLSIRYFSSYYLLITQKTIRYFSSYDHNLLNYKTHHFLLYRPDHQRVVAQLQEEEEEEEEGEGRRRSHRNNIKSLKVYIQDRISTHCQYIFVLKQNQQQSL